MDNRPDTLDRLRARIDTLDDVIFQAIADRLDTADRIGDLKRDLGMPIHQPDREAHLLDALRTRARSNGINPTTVNAVWTLIIKEARRRQEVLSQQPDPASGWWHE